MCGTCRYPYTSCWLGWQRRSVRSSYRGGGHYVKVSFVVNITRFSEYAVTVFVITPRHPNWDAPSHVKTQPTINGLSRSRTAHPAAAPFQTRHDIPHPPNILSDIEFLLLWLDLRSNHLFSLCCHPLLIFQYLYPPIFTHELAELSGPSHDRQVTLSKFDCVVIYVFN